MGMGNDEPGRGRAGEADGSSSGKNNGARLSLVSDLDGEPAGEPRRDLYTHVRCIRRDMAQLLRAMQASGRGLSSLPDPVTTRLAHADAVTAGYLLDAELREEREVRAAANSMRDVEHWILDRLPAGQLRKVRAHAMRVLVADEELCKPLVRTEWTGDELTSEGGNDPEQECQVMRHALSQLPEPELARVCRRLGIRVEAPPWSEAGARSSASHERLRAEQSVLNTLLDGHLLSILIATLPGEAHRLLAALIRGSLDDATLHRISVRVPLLEGDGLRLGVTLETPAQLLRSCGLAFSGGVDGRLWVPVELHRRVDGVLRAFGV